MKTFSPSLIAICCALAVVCTGSKLSAQTYSARNDFSLASNPNGVWSYGSLSAVTGGTFTPFSVALTDHDYTGQQLWYNGGSYPNAYAVQANTTGQSVKFGTVLVPADQLNLDGESVIAAVRWTAPADGTYNVAGFFQRNDDQTSAGPVPVMVAIVQNASGTYYQQGNFIAYGSQQPFNLSALPLIAGTTLDFEEISAVPHNDTVGLAATITRTGALTTPVINISATTPQIVAGSGTPGIFTLTRAGDASQEIIVAYAVKGSGLAGVDYVMLKGTKKFKAGKASVQIKVQSIAETNPAAKKSVKLTLQTGTNYVLGTSTVAKVKIVSGD